MLDSDFRRMRWERKKRWFCLAGVILEYIKDEVKIDNTMSQSLLFLWKECETLVHMAKTRVWYAIPDCSSTKLALLWTILNLSYTDFSWCKFGHRAPRQEVTQAESSRGFQSAGGLVGTAAAYEVGGVEWERESKLALDSEGRKKKN